MKTFFLALTSIIIIKNCHVFGSLKIFMVKITNFINDRQKS
jgi:hypothetical protein